LPPGAGDSRTAEQIGICTSTPFTLAEAARGGLRLNDHGWTLLHNPGAPDPSAPVVHESYGWRWSLLGIVPRLELFNDQRPPRKEWSWLHPATMRDPMAPPWPGKIALCHESAVDCWKDGGMRVVATVPPERPRGPLNA
jgi:hypothetical protein